MQAVGQLQRVHVARAAAEHEREQLVVAEPCGAEPFELLARPIVWCDVFHQRYTQVAMLRRSSACACVCRRSAPLPRVRGTLPTRRWIRPRARSTPPARPAPTGTRRPSTPPRPTRSRTPTTPSRPRDYRLALNYALESREQAQNAARGAADAKARVRAEVERGITEITALIAQARVRLMAAERARVARRLLQQPRADLAAADAALQKAGEAVGAEDYLAARESLDGVKERVNAALVAINDDDGAAAGTQA